jgi:hypothetical protein
MFRTDAEDIYTMSKEYITQVPMELAVQLTLIEKRDWPLFRDSSYNMFGEFIYRNLYRYPQLKDHISKTNYKFEFIYEYLTDNSMLLHTTYYSGNQHISEAEYLLHTYRKYYFERWIIVDCDLDKTLIFFECEYVPDQKSKNSFIALNL